MGLVSGPFVPFIPKDPSSIEPQGFTWEAFLAKLGTGVQITDSTWRYTGPDAALTITDDSIEPGNLKTKAIFSGGTPGAQYIVTNRITTNSTPVVTDERSFGFVMNER